MDVWIWVLDYKESWVLKNWCWCWRRLESPLDCKKIKPVNPKGNQSLIFIGRTDAEAETPILWPRDVRYWFVGTDPDAGKDWRKAGEGDDRGWDGWISSPTWWTWVWVSSGSWCWTGKPGMLHSMGSQRVGHNWTTELNRCMPYDSKVVRTYHYNFLQCFSLLWVGCLHLPFLQPRHILCVAIRILGARPSLSAILVFNSSWLSLQPGLKLALF